jgi:integrase
MKRIVEKMDQHTAKTALAMVGKDECEWSDTDPRGLIIRVHKRGAVWALRGRLGPKKTLWTIGPVLPPGTQKVISLTDARTWARKAQDMLSNGTDPGDWLREQATGAKVEKHFDKVKDGLSWVDGRDAFLKFLANNGQPPKTISDYTVTLMSVNVKDFEAWEKSGKLLKNITVNDVLVLRQRIIDRGKIEQARHTQRVLSACMTYLAGYPNSGITENIVLTVKPIPSTRRSKAAKGQRLGKLRSPEVLGEMAWTLAKHDGTPSSRLAAAIMLFTSQRVETVLRARKSEIEPAATGGLWDIPPAHIKSQREHLLPLPSVAYHLFRQAIAISPSDSPFIFPQVRRWRADDEMDGHLSYRAVRNAMVTEKDKAAKEEVDAAKPTAKRDLFTTHDFRKSFGTHAKTLLGFTTADIKTILDHAEGVAGDVTEDFYILSHGEGAKWKILLAWEKWLLEQIALQSGGRGKAPAFLDAPQVADTRVQAAIEKMMVEEGGVAWSELGGGR